jgi:hypothetical protein
MKAIVKISMSFATAIIAVKAAHANTCTLYEHRNFGGARYVLQNGDDLQMINPPDIGTSDGIHIASEATCECGGLPNY